MGKMERNGFGKDIRATGERRKQERGEKKQSGGKREREERDRQDNRDMLLIQRAFRGGMCKLNCWFLVLCAVPANH